MEINGLSSLFAQTSCSNMYDCLWDFTLLLLSVLLQFIQTSLSLSQPPDVSHNFIITQLEKGCYEKMRSMLHNCIWSNMFKKFIPNESLIDSSPFNHYVYMHCNVTQITRVRMTKQMYFHVVQNHRSLYPNKQSTSPHDRERQRRWYSLEPIAKPGWFRCRPPLGSGIKSVATLPTTDAPAQPGHAEGIFKSPDYYHALVTGIRLWICKHDSRGELRVHREQVRFPAQFSAL